MWDQVPVACTSPVSTKKSTVPLGPYYFQEYKAYVTKAEVERVRAESSAEYVDPAKNATACYDEYRAQEYRTAMLDEKIDGPPIADDVNCALVIR